MHSHNSSLEFDLDLERYEIVRQLGAGGAGAVYLARDRETQELLALKKLQKIDHKSVLRFKREFRSFANVHHPNLVRLYDLGHTPDGWFLTMEYVNGSSLNEELRAASDVYATRGRRLAASNDQGFEAAFVERLIDRFKQLASAVSAIHHAGMLHRDLKPSNVMVAQGGRVVVLDFGLVRDIAGDAQDNRVTQEGIVTGTPAYMSPEQTTAESLSEASDWYAFGAMLYEMLCGQLPINGRNVSVLLARKLREDPAPLADDPAVPAQLRQLCMGLLHREPGARPSGEHIMAVFAALRPESELRAQSMSEELVPHTDVALALSNAALFGRDSELTQLRSAFERAEQFRTVVAHVRGTSGAGKSALVERFLDELELGAGAEVLVLRSRCYEREAMPFKALDGVIDAMVADMLKLDPVTTAHLLPVGITALAQLFPVFERLPVVSRLIAERKRIDEPAEVRRRADQALKELIVRSAATRPLVIWIDDLQWGDLDSASVIESWLKQSEDVPLFLIFSYRIEEVETSPCLKLLLDPLANSAGASDAVVMDMAPLSDDSVRELCTERLRSTSSAPVNVIDRIVREARGNPFLAQQLTALALAKQARGEKDLESLSMEELVNRFVGLLQPPARELLNVLAIAGRPLAPGLALSAADILHDGRSHIHSLQSLRLVRTRVVGGQRWVEVYHDRVREGVQALLSAAELEQQHARLLDALERAQLTDPDWLHELAMGARNTSAAYRYGRLAADRASAALAFERAAELYARCLSLNEQPANAADLWVKRGMALTRCRRGADAAQAYLHAAELVEPAAQPPLLRFAASHLLRSGRFEEGERLVARVLDLLQLDVPKSELGLMAAIGWERARIAMRGYKVKPHSNPQVGARLARAAELYGTLSVETQLYAPVRAALFTTRSLRLALESGDAPHVARSLCLTAALLCVSGTPRAARHADGLFALVDSLSKHFDSDDVGVENPTGRALAATFLGRPHEVIQHSDAANRAYDMKTAGGGHGDYFYWFAVNAARLAALQSLGQHVQARDELRAYLARAKATGNRAAMLQVTLTQTLAERSTNNCAESRARLDAERNELPGGEFGILRLLHMIATMLAACSNGEHQWALTRLNEDWPAYLRNALHGTAYIATVAHFTHARLLLNHHVLTRSRMNVEHLIRPDVRAIASLPQSPYRDAVLLRLRARSAFLRGDSSNAVASLQQSAQLLESASYLDEPQRDRFAIGRIVGGAEGARQCDRAEARLRSLGALVPGEEMRGYCPELFSAGPNGGPQVPQ